MKGRELALKIADLAKEKKGFNIKIINISHLKLSFDYFVLITGTVDQHIKALSEFIRKELSREGEKPIGYEGQSNLRWVILDYVDVVVHIFDEMTRDLYKLENLWNEAEIEDIE